MAINHNKVRREKRLLRHRRVRSRITGMPDRPRFSVFRSGQHIYAQIIDDVNGKTLAKASDLAVKKGTKTERAAEVGTLIAQEAKNAGITTVSFDRGGYKYHGRVKAVAEAARKAGLIF